MQVVRAKHSQLAADANKTNTTATTDETNAGTAQKSDSETNKDSVKDKIESDVKSFVTAGTITQAQADKIVAALTTRNAPSGNNKPPQGKEKNGSKDNSTGEGKGFSPLNNLVSDGTITQDQADTVMKKISADMPHNKENVPQK